MKRFFVNGDTANWANLNVVALNVKSGIIEDTTAIPENLRLQVTIADKFDTNVPDCEALSLATSEYAMRHGKRRHFLLLNGNRVVGWAAFHRKERDFTVRVIVTTADTYTVKAKSVRDALKKASYLATQQYRGDVLAARVLTDEEVEEILNPVDLED